MSIETMGGYRLVRKLGEGPRADVLLGYPARAGSVAPPAAIKLFRPAVSGESMMTEIEALTRAEGPHCVALLDLASSPEGGSALVLGRLTGGSLSKLLAERNGLRIGEAITVLGPVATTLMRMHDSGVAHCAVVPDRVLFDSEGAPVIIGFGCARLLPPALPAATLGSHELVTADYAAFARLARSVLTRVHDERALELADWFTQEHYEEGWVENASRRIYGLGDASAVDLAPVAGDRSPTLPSRALTSSPVPVSRDRWKLLDQIGAPDWVHEALRDPRVRVSKLVRTVRPRVWITAAAVAVALVCAVALIPSSDSDATADAPTPLTTQGASAADGPIAGEDPIAALLVLWEKRERCIRDMSVLCLDAVDQANSSALASDQQVVRSLQAGEESHVMTTLESDRLSIAESLGDTAIVSIDSPTDSEPASILMMRSEAGWRIRDYLD